MTGTPAGTSHAGEELRWLRERAGMTIEDVAARAGVDAGWLAEPLENGVGTHDVLYSQWVDSGESDPTTSPGVVG